MTMRAEELAMLVNGLDMKQNAAARTGVGKLQRIKMFWNICARARVICEASPPWSALDPQAWLAILERELHSANRDARMGELGDSKRDAENPASAKSGCGNGAFKMLGPHSETLSDLQLELLAERRARRHR